MHKNEWGLNDPSELRVEPALMYDAVQLFARAFKRLKDAIKGDVRQLPCNGSLSWEHGYSLSNFMRLVSLLYTRISWNTKFLKRYFNFTLITIIKIFTPTELRLTGCWEASVEITVDRFQSETVGLTGLIKFDTAGFRSDFQLDVIRVAEDGVKKIGTWNSTNSIEWLPENRPINSDIEFSLQNKTFIVLIAIVRWETIFQGC